MLVKGGKKRKVSIARVPESPRAPQSPPGTFPMQPKRTPWNTFFTPMDLDEYPPSNNESNITL
jgi:hypothetical protein